MKYLANIFLIFIILFFSLFTFESCTKPKEPVAVVSKTALEDSWRKPTEEEHSTLDSLFVRYKFYDYEDFFLKEIESDTFIVACLTNEKKWDYYYSNAKSDQLTVLSAEMKREITPP